MAELKVDKYVVVEGVRDIFRSLNISATGRLYTSTLEKEWEPTSLREVDLVRGLDLLVGNGELEVVGKNSVRLTAKGYEEIHAQLSRQDLRHRFAAQRTLAKARKRFKSAN